MPGGLVGLSNKRNALNWGKRPLFSGIIKTEM